MTTMKKIATAKYQIKYTEQIHKCTPFYICDNRNCLSIHIADHVT